jgi:hypothetical protein
LLDKAFGWIDNTRLHPSTVETVLAVGGLAELTLSDQVAQNCPAGRFAEPEKSRGLRKVE